MNHLAKMWLVGGIMDLGATLFTYFMAVKNDLVYLIFVPTILMLCVFIPISKMIIKIYRTIEKQNGKCYNCNLMILDKDDAPMLNGHVYHNSCLDTDRQSVGSVE